jgi:1,2-diacylglycerol 3-alpha-glucosyltransferase
MRLLIVGTTYHPAHNGQAVFTTQLAEGLVRRGHAATVVVPALRGPARFERNGVLVHALPSLTLGRWHPDAALPLVPGRALRAIMAAAAPEIVHVHDHYPLSRVAVRLARRIGARIVGTDHFVPDNLKPYLPGSHSAGRAYDRALWLWMLDLYNRLDIVTAPSETAASILRSNGLRVPVHPISCGVDVHRFRPMPDLDRATWRRRYGLDGTRALCLYVGRLDGEKGVDVLLHAVSLLGRDSMILGIAGKGAARLALEELARTLGLGDRVRFLGFVPDEDLPALLNSADLFAMPSTAELLSIATLEAMACGRPVLAARARALPELVSDGDNG